MSFEGLLVFYCYAVCVLLIYVVYFMRGLIGSGVAYGLNGNPARFVSYSMFGLHALDGLIWCLLVEQNLWGVISCDF